MTPALKSGDVVRFSDQIIARAREALGAAAADSVVMDALVCARGEVVRVGRRVAVRWRDGELGHADLEDLELVDLPIDRARQVAEERLEERKRDQ